VLETLPGPLDLTPLIQGLLGTSRTLMMNPPVPTSISSLGLSELMSYGKSLSQLHHQSVPFKGQGVMVTYKLCFGRILYQSVLEYIFSTTLMLNFHLTLSSG
jgi:hypothetical protein